MKSQPAKTRILLDRGIGKYKDLEEGEQWYSNSMKVICVWLADRLDLQLHIYQLKTLIKVVKKTYGDFRLQGVLEGTLNSKTYDTVHRRLTVEETTASVSEGGGLQGITMKDSDEEEEA